MSEQLAHLLAHLNKSSIIYENVLMLQSHFETLRARMRLLQQFEHGIALEAVESVARKSAATVSTGLPTFVWKNRKFDILKKSWKSIVNVVLIEAKDLPDGPTGNLYCKFKLGNEDHKSKQVSKSKPMWCERCLIDISRLDKEKTHDIWQELDCGFGSLHMLVTISGSASMVVDNVPTTTGAHIPPATDDF
ncbi:putative transmembrane 1 protein, partial [Operophtera brumata]